MSAGREQIRVALQGQATGLLRAEILAKCAAGKSTVKSALQAMIKSKEVAANTSDGPHKTRYTLTGERVAPPQRQRKLKRARKLPRQQRRAPAAKAPTQLLPAMTADNRLLVVAPDRPAQVYSVEDTKLIAELMLAHFEAD